MCIFKKTYYYDPQIRRDDLGYSVDIYEYDGRKSKLVGMYVDKDYKKVLEKARDHCNPLTNCQK